ncbi:hypothetical protein DAETH_14290 [Deinococcus aetherius]|uniref:Uncharacterized protein n=1 Tax=Deinococcus aetherius TaxID=200252 RepID=A0ABM8ACD4_9DEIO|nr:hypothetical protein [Deinococcus aetherius]BDP41460.1 hypothetical protein DAETH_14290 [Deinococcus aetherius]
MRGDDGDDPDSEARTRVRALRWGLVLLLLLAVVALAALTLGVFATLNPNAPLWLRSLGSLEGVLSAQAGLGEWGGFDRAVALTVLTSLLAGLAAYLKPRG